MHSNARPLEARGGAFEYISICTRRCGRSSTSTHQSLYFGHIWSDDDGDDGDDNYDHGDDANSEIAHAGVSAVGKSAHASLLRMVLSSWIVHSRHISTR